MCEVLDLIPVPKNKKNNISDDWSYKREPLAGLSPHIQAQPIFPSSCVYDHPESWSTRSSAVPQYQLLFVALSLDPISPLQVLLN